MILHDQELRPTALVAMGMHRRTFLTTGAAISIGAIAGCLGSDGTIAELETGDESLVGEATVDLDAGEYELFVSFDTYDESGEGIDEAYARGTVDTEGFGETIAQVELTSEGSTGTDQFEVDGAGSFEVVVHAPTTESAVSARLEER